MFCARALRRLVAAEEELGPLLALVERASAGELRFSEIVGLFWHCLADRRDVTREQVGEAVMRQGLADMRQSPCARSLPKSSKARGERAVSDRTRFASSRLAARMLGWRPNDFWAATPAELAGALAPVANAPGQPLARADLEKMMGIRQ